MEFFVTIANGWKLQTIDTRSFALHAAGVLDLPGNRQNGFMRFTYSAHRVA